VLAGVAVAAALVALATARAAAVLDARRQELLAAVGSAVGWPIEAASLEVSWWPPAVVARQVRVPDASPYGPGNLGYADEARFEFELLPLVRGRLVVNEVRLQAPVLRIVRGADGGWNLTRQAPPEPIEPRPRGGEWIAPRVVVDTVRVRNARITYRDRAIPGLGELEVKAANLRLRHGSSGVLVDFNGQALGGPEENVQGRLRIPGDADGPRTATLEIDAENLAASQVPEIISVLRGQVPYGFAFGGEAAVRVRATMNAAWPPGSAAIEVAVDARDATVRAAGGWIDKRAGSPLAADIGLVADGENLAVERAVLRLAGSELRADADGPPGRTGQPPLRFAVERLDGKTVAEWVPALAALQPSGSIAVSGRLAPGSGPLATEVHLTGRSLGFVARGRHVDVGGGDVRLVVSDDSDRVLGSARFDDVRGADASAGAIEIAVGGAVARPLTVKIGATRGSLRGAPVEKLALECILTDDGVEVRSLRADGLGGFAVAHGRVTGGGAEPWQVSFEPEWEGLDLSAILLAVGGPAHGSGVLRGRARLATRIADVESALTNLVGDVDVILTDGRLADLNVAGTTLDNLRGIPKLREAVERRARERVPELLVSTSEISLLRVRGAIAARSLAISDLTLESDHYALDARGQVAFDGQTDLDGTLALTPAAAEALVSDAGVVQILASSNGQVRIPVTVRGTYPRLSSAPTSDFLARAMARAIASPPSEGGGSGDWLRRLLRGGRADREPSGAAAAP